MSESLVFGVDAWTMLFLSTIAWVCCIVLVARFCRRTNSLGLPLAYLLLMTIVHGGGVVYLVPGYNPANNAALSSQGASLYITSMGFFLSVIGVAAFTLGVFTVRYIVSLRPSHADQSVTDPLKFGKSLMIVGALFFFAIAPFASLIPSGAAVTSSGVQLTIVGICIFATAAIRSSVVSKFSALAATASIPAVTIILMGFVGYAVVALIEIVSFFIGYIRFRLATYLIGLAAIWLGLSFYVTYMQGRDEIRGKVWGKASLTERVSTMAEKMSNYEIFDPWNYGHLYLFDIRMNQNLLVGRCHEHINNGSGEFFYGESIFIAAVAWIPRIIWPGKPSFGGSSGFASQFTGMNFASGTSVGVGQVMEFYANFGIVGIVVGFFLLGAGIRYLDSAAAISMKCSQMWGVTKYVLLGFSLMQPGGLLAELVASFAASYMLTMFLSWLLSKSSMFQNNKPSPVAIHGTR